jgi:hypothetical protein
MAAQFFVLSRRLRPNDLNWLNRSTQPELIVFGQALLSDFAGVDPGVKVYALQEEVKETGLVPQFEGKVELKSGPELIDLLVHAKLIHL